MGGLAGALSSLTKICEADSGSPPLPQIPVPCWEATCPASCWVCWLWALRCYRPCSSCSPPLNQSSRSGNSFFFFSPTMSRHLTLVCSTFTITSSGFQSILKGHPSKKEHTEATRADGISSWSRKVRESQRGETGRGRREGAHTQGSLRSTPSLAT